MQQMLRKPKRNPSFFKIMFGDFIQKLRVPPAFVQHFNDVFPKQLILTVGEKRWNVEMMKLENKYFLGRGWKYFIENNFIEFGDLLFFELFGDSKFHVKIYGKSGCEKNRNIEKDQFTVIQKKSCSSEGKQIRDQVNNHERKLPKRPAFPDKVTEGLLNSIGPSRKRLRMTSQEKEELEAAFPFKSNYPFFKVKLALTYVQKPFLAIPHSFARTLGPKKSISAIILDSEGRTWPVTYTVSCKAYICKGWSAVVSGNGLKEDSVCAFELIEYREDSIKLKLSILRYGRKSVGFGLDRP